MFINLSNHPSDRWGEKQRQYANDLGGELKDIPFPHINAQATTHDILKLAREYFTQVKKMADGETVVVHLMGEMTFTHALVRFLQKNDIRCVASTTERIVEEQDGKKIVQFNFIQFRDYPNI